MATVFGKHVRIIFIDCLQKRKTITGEYYANLLQKLNEENKRKFSKKKAVSTRPIRTSLITMTKIHQLKFELLYSPELAPCGFYLFPNLKKWLGRKRLENDNEVIDVVNYYFEDLDKSTY
jgi:hypothetical protein